MRPDQYTDFAGVFDILCQQGRLLSPGYAFVRSVLDFLGETDRLADLGGGTGLLSEHLLFWRPNLRITFVEPSEHMMPIARKRLGEQVEHFVPQCYQHGALPARPFDALLSVRSLYVMEEDSSSYPALFARMADDLRPGGHLFLMDLREKFSADISETRKNLHEHLVPEHASTEEFKRIMEIFVWSREEFNRNVDDGRYHLFSQSDLDEMTAASGFTPVSYSEKGAIFSAVYRLAEDSE